MANDLVIEIKGSAKEFMATLDQVKGGASDLNEQLGTIAKLSALAFGLSAAEIGDSVRLYGEKEEALNRLSQAMQTQGLYSDDLLEKYKAQAEAIQSSTGIDADQVVQAQAVMQGLIGQTKITDQLTKSTVDFAAAQGMDLKSAFTAVSEAVNGHVMMLNRLGLHIDANADKSTRLAQITEQLSERFNGAAAAANDGVDGSFRKMHTAFDDLQKEIGEQFAPAVKSALDAMTGFFGYLGEHQELVNFIAISTAAIGIAGGLALAVSGTAIGFLKLREALEAAGIAEEAMSLTTKGLLAATGIGLLLVIVGEIYMHWNDLWPRIHGIYSAFVANVTDLSHGLGEILSGVFHFDKAKIEQGLADVKAAIAKGLDDQGKMTEQYQKQQEASQEQHLTKQSAVSKEFADKAEAERAAREQRHQATIKAENEVLVLQSKQASADLIALKKEEVATLQKLEDDKYAHERGALQQHLSDIHFLEEQQQKDDEAKTAAYAKLKKSHQDQFDKMDENQRRQFDLKESADLKKQIDTKQTAQEKYLKNRMDLQIKADNQFLQDQIQFGTAYATINEAMHSEVYEGTKSAFSDMEQMQNSHNSTLKEIGKISAMATIAIKTAESAMNVYAGFSTIPIIGPALGIAAAAATIAYGVEQEQNVMAAADGGLITGGTPGVDSVPALLMPGELVVPQRNYDEVVSSVASNRNGSGGSGESTQNVNVSIGFDGREAAQVLTVRQNENKALGTSRAV